MHIRISAITACLLGLATAVPFSPRPLLRRQTDKYPDNGTLADPPPVTPLTRQNPSYTTEQYNELKLAYTAIDRFALLQSYGSNDDYFKFDLTPNGSVSNAANGLGGQGYLAEVKGWPVLMNTGISVAIGYLNPCGLDSIHIHNRADEIVTLVKGQSLKTGFVLEDGFDLVMSMPCSFYLPLVLLLIFATACVYRDRLVSGHDPVSSRSAQSIRQSCANHSTRLCRPKGSQHWEFNDHCESAVFVASLSNEDPSVSRTAQNFFINPQDIVEADLSYPKWFSKVRAEVRIETGASGMVQQ